MTLHDSAHAAREILKLVLIFVLHSAANGHHVAHSAVIGVLGRQDVIEKRALVEVYVANLGIDRKEFARHFDHVIDVAGFRGAAVDHVVQFVWRAEVLVLSMSTSRKAVMPCYLIPEKRGSFVVRFISRVNISHQ